MHLEGKTSGKAKQLKQHIFMRLQQIVVNVLLRPCQRRGAEVLVNSC